MNLFNIVTTAGKWLPLRVGRAAAIAVAGLLANQAFAAAEPVQFSGRYPHLTMYNESPEAGQGAAVYWQERLWVGTPNGRESAKPFLPVMGSPLGF